MKKQLVLAILCVAAVLAILMSGCATTQTITEFPDGTFQTNTVTQLDPERTGNAIRAIIPPAVVLAISQEPESRDYINKARLAVCLLAYSTDPSPERLKAAIGETGIRELKTEEAQVAISAIYGIYQVYYGEVVAQNLNKSEWLLPVLKSICDGLSDGLAAAPLPPPDPEPVVAPVVIDLQAPPSQ